jgi:hypothetical protein
MLAYVRKELKSEIMREIDISYELPHWLKINYENAIKEEE